MREKMPKLFFVVAATITILSAAEASNPVELAIFSAASGWLIRGLFEQALREKWSEHEEGSEV